MTTASEPQLHAYLTGRGWRPPEEAGGLWQHPSGRTSNLTRLNWDSETEYDAFLAEIGRIDGRAYLAVKLDVEGHQADQTDLTALDSAIETWRRAHEDAGPAAASGARESGTLLLHRIDPDQRRTDLLRMRDALDAVIAAFDGPRRYDPLPAVLRPAAAGPRTRRWERELELQPWFDRWPAFMRERIATALTAAEADLIAGQLEEHFEDLVRDYTPGWAWDPDQDAAVHDGGSLEPPPAPDLTAILDRVRADLDPRRAEHDAARRLITDFPHREHPDARDLRALFDADGADRLTEQAVAAIAVFAHQLADTAAPADMGARHAAWASELHEQAWFSRWPTLIRGRIVDQIVGVETDRVTDHLDALDPRDDDRATDWEWDPRIGRVREPDGTLAPHSPAATAITLSVIRSKIHLRRIEASVALGWIANAIEDPALPTHLQVAAFDFFRDPMRLDALGRWNERELTDPLADEIIDLLARVYRPGQTVPGPFSWPATGQPPSPASHAFPAGVDTGTAFDTDPAASTAPAAELVTVPYRDQETAPAAAEAGPDEGMAR